MIFVTGDTHGDWMTRLNSRSFPEGVELTKDDYMRYKTYPVIVDYKYNDGCVDEVLDFCDYDFEEKKWKLDNPHKVRQYFPLPSKHKIKC